MNEFLFELCSDANSTTSVSKLSKNRLYEPRLVPLIFEFVSDIIEKSEFYDFYTGGAEDRHNMGSKYYIYAGKREKRSLSNSELIEKATKLLEERKVTLKFGDFISYDCRNFLYVSKGRFVEQTRWSRPRVYERIGEIILTPQFLVSVKLDILYVELDISPYVVQLQKNLKKWAFKDYYLSTFFTWRGRKIHICVPTTGEDYKISEIRGRLSTKKYYVNYFERMGRKYRFSSDNAERNYYLFNTCPHNDVLEINLNTIPTFACIQERYFESPEYEDYRDN